MGFTPVTAENLIRIGANLVVKDSKLNPVTLEKLAQIAVSTGSHLTIHAEGLPSVVLEKVAAIGKDHVTIVI